MPIIRAHVPYVSVPLYLIRGGNLPPKARMLAIYLYTFEGEYNFTSEKLHEDLGIHPDNLPKIIGQLVQAGYLSKNSDGVYEILVREKVSCQ